MSSAPIFDVYPDQLSLGEIPNGSLAQSQYIREARNRQWATMTAFAGTPLSFSGVLTDETFTIKLLAPPYVKYAWPAIIAAGAITESSLFFGNSYKPGTVHFTVDTHDATYGSRLQVFTEEVDDTISEAQKDATFLAADSIELITKNSVADTQGSWLQVASSGSTATWRDFKLNIEIPDGITVYQVFLLSLIHI